MREDVASDVTPSLAYASGCDYCENRNFKTHASGCDCYKNATSFGQVHHFAAVSGHHRFKSWAIDIYGQ
jgi:hypothetical protein